MRMGFGIFGKGVLVECNGFDVVLGLAADGLRG